MISRTIAIRAELCCETGLHIGNNEGGNPPRGLNALVLQNPVFQKNGGFAPYISATSLKGKLRNIAEILFEKELNLDFVNETGPTRVLRRHECLGMAEASECPVCFLFGSSSGARLTVPTAASQNENFQGRLLFRNAPLKPAVEDPLTKNTSVPSEQKTENAINRLSRRANPRQNERVPGQALFDFEVVYLVYENEVKVNDHLSDLAACLRFLETNYIGGNGSRGYGKVKFNNLEVGGKAYDSLQVWHVSLLEQEVDG